MKQAMVGIAVISALLAGCGSDRGDVQRKPGWNSDLVETLIACQPNPGPVCDCLIPRVTEKYTPEQVKQNSALVAQDLLAIQKSCGGGDHDQLGTASGAPQLPHGGGH